MTEIEIAWLAGLLEGEGTFCAHRIKRKTKKHQCLNVLPRFQIQMNDRDIIEKVAKLVDANVLGPYSNTRSSRPNYNPNPKPCWVVSKVGKESAQIMERLLPYLGERRTEQIRSMLAEAGSYKLPLDDNGTQDDCSRQYACDT